MAITNYLKKFSIRFFKVDSCPFRITIRATAIDHIITNAMLESTVDPGIIKANMYNYFTIFTVLENSCSKYKY